jgi:Ser/Thr protein kinase RdoA (MazF antagonist)
MPTQLPMTAASADAARAAAAVAAGFGIAGREPVILSDGANVIVHLSPSPVVAKVATTTTLVRPDAAAWLQRELDVASFLAGQNAAALAPSPEIPATTHRAGGHVMSFWPYLSPSDALPDEATIGSMLRDLHAALRGYPGALGLLTPLGDIPRFLTRTPAMLSAADRSMLGEAFARLTAELGREPGAAQSLHGDAGGGNLMAAGTGWVWHDFEDTCSGPVTWDLAASTASQRLDRARILRAYGTPVDAARLAVCEQLRRLHLTVWYALYAERLPQHRRRAAELLASWRAP